MRIRTTIAIVVVVLSTCVASKAQNRNGEQVRRLERAWLDAYEKHDAEAMDEIVADDFVITFPDGSMQTKAQIIAMIKAPRQAGRPAPRFSTEDVQARVYGNTVILMGRVVTEWKRDGQTQSKEQQRYTDTYVKRNGRWQVVASHLSNVK
ncbi:MAG TPA: nuclear transport factor 2 family protein [Pyrinomonadaceae bacterium]